MDGDHGLRDLRFEGYSNEDLAQQVDGLRGGQGSETLHNAMRALISLATSLSDTDRVLREQLAELGVSWTGQAGAGGAQATQAAAVYAEAAVAPVSESAKGVATQSGTFSHTRDSAPDSGALRGPTQLNGYDRFAGMFGHTTDHAKDVKNTSAARDATIGGMNSYQRNSGDAIDKAKGLPVPPGMDLVTRPAGVGTSVNSVRGPNTGGGAFNAGATQVPGGGGGGIQTNVPGPIGPFSGTPGIPRTPGGPGAPTVAPGPNTGAGPIQPLPAPAPTPNTPPLRAVPSILAAETAALALAGGAGAQLGAAAEKDQVVRGKPGAVEPGKGTPAPKSPGVAVGSVPEDDARSVRNAERFGAKPGKAMATPLMQPAATARDEEDTEHVRKFGVDSADVFDDGRMISPALIGDEDED
jgi:hypothetical protein